MNEPAPVALWLQLPGWLVGSLVCAAIVMVAAPSLLRASRVRRRIAALGAQGWSSAGAGLPSDAAATARPVTA
ncbi:MAG: hypothetical protein ACRD0A_12290, partial [Acidimicrobiales bacterium]